MTVADVSVLPVAEQLLACLTDITRDLEKPPKAVMLRPGNEVELLLSLVDDECCSGVGWVRVVQVYPSTAQFPAPDLVPDKCGPIRFAATYELGIARCAPRPGASQMPTPDQWNEVSAAVLADGAAMRQAICCWSDLNRDTLHVYGVWQPLATQGGCVGGVQQVTVAVPACDCPD